MVDKWSIKPSLAEKMVDILFFMADKHEITTEAIVSQFGFTPTTAKRYLRQLTEFGYLVAHGGNKNRTYTMPISAWRCIKVVKNSVETLKLILKLEFKITNK